MIRTPPHTGDRFPGPRTTAQQASDNVDGGPGGVAGGIGDEEAREVHELLDPAQMTHGLLELWLVDLAAANLVRYRDRQPPDTAG